jgi:hypothetical protein
MKIVIISLSWILMLVGVFGMSESLEKLIESVNGKEDGEFGYDQRMIAAWPGLESEAGLNEILDLVLQPGRNENYPEGMNILDAMRFPREKIVGMILEKVKDRNDHESGLNRGFGVLQRFTDDPRVFDYLIGFINDHRPMGRREPMATADYGSVAFRISDCAAGVIRHGLQKRGLLKPGEPAWGEPGGATTYENADGALILLKELLVKNQLMTAEQSLARPKKEAVMSNSSMDPAPESRAQMRERRRPDPVIESKQQISPWLWIWIGILAIGGSLGWKFMKLRS